ncbi:hypothetical protein M9H77_11652 [Catharanthus roseus]|uniref:Uncharacterized protein n=1 Tax=Catharanthus roseus TaxID=4058 RepID=A0ACC0BFC6_CATRO|nr:hypothetical protein M9H77_11652 [Catharanthus roseus]
MLPPLLLVTEMSNCDSYLSFRLQKFQDDVQMLGAKIKHYESGIKFLKGETNRLDDLILDMQVSLGKYHSDSEQKLENLDLPHDHSEEETIKNILRHANSAAGILCQLKTHHQVQASNIPWMKDVLGVVATLGKLLDDNLSRLLAAYLGVDTMLALVCKTETCVKALETYNDEGSIIKSSGLHGLGMSVGRSLDDQFLVICLENMSPYAGHFIADDPQRRLDLLKPKLPNGETPSGFLGFAVNMIYIDPTNLHFVTNNGRGLRETLFYHLFSSLQVYKTREDMLRAHPLISNGAISLDGGMIKNRVVFSLGNRKVMDVKFPIVSGKSHLPDNYAEIEKILKAAKWEKDRLLEDVRREEALLNQSKLNYEVKKQEYLKFLAESSSYAAQVGQNGRGLTPR